MDFYSKEHVSYLTMMCDWFSFSSLHEAYEKTLATGFIYIIFSNLENWFSFLLTFFLSHQNTGGHKLFSARVIQPIFMAGSVSNIPSIGSVRSKFCLIRMCVCTHVLLLYTHKQSQIHTHTHTLFSLSRTHSFLSLRHIHIHFVSYTRTSSSFLHFLLFPLHISLSLTLSLPLSLSLADSNFLFFGCALSISHI